MRSSTHHELFPRPHALQVRASSAPCDLLWNQTGVTLPPHCQILEVLGRIRIPNLELPDLRGVPSNVGNMARPNMWWGNAEPSQRSWNAIGAVQPSSLHAPALSAGTTWWDASGCRPELGRLDDTSDTIRSNLVKPWLKHPRTKWSKWRF